MPKYHCPICDKFINSKGWQYHLHTKTHLLHAKLTPDIEIPTHQPGAHKREGTINCSVCEKWLTPSAWRYHLKSKIHLLNIKLNPSVFISNRTHRCDNINKDAPSPSTHLPHLLPPDEFDDMGHFIIRF